MADSVAVRHKLRVKQRRRVVEYATAHGIKPASRHFGLDRRTVRTWVDAKMGGDQGLVPRCPDKRKRRLAATTLELIRVARVDLRYGAPRTQVWLKRVHHLQINTRTIPRVFRDIGVPVLTPQRRPKQMMVFEKNEPGDSVQVDVKVVKLQRDKVFQYTAIDDCTRLSPSRPADEPARPRGTASRPAVSYSQAAMRQRQRVSAGL